MYMPFPPSFELSYGVFSFINQHVVIAIVCVCFLKDFSYSFINQTHIKLKIRKATGVGRGETHIQKLFVEWKSAHPQKNPN